MSIQIVEMTLKILFLIRSLDPGGAERQLVELVKHLDQSQFEPVIVTFYDGGLLKKEIENENHINYISLSKSGRWDVFAFFLQLIKIVHQEKPDLIHGYLDVANLFALCVGRFMHVKVVWGLRASDIDLKKYDWTAGFVFRLSSILSFLADCIIVNSDAGRKYHIQQGFSAQRMTVIPNGINTSRFYPDITVGKSMR